MPTICTGASIMQSERQGDYCCSAVRLKFTIKKKKGLFISCLSKLLTVNSSFIDVNVMKLSTAWAFTVILKFSSFLHARGAAIKLTEGELWFVFNDSLHSNLSTKRNERHCMLKWDTIVQWKVALCCYLKTSPSLQGTCYFLKPDSPVREITALCPRTTWFSVFCMLTKQTPQLEYPIYANSRNRDISFH